MCGTPSIGDVVRGATDVATFGTAEIGGISKKLGNLADGKSNSYTPTMLPNEDPKLTLAQSGGAPLLTQIALGANVEDALAGYFGKGSGADFKQYYDSLDPAGKSAIDSVRNQLTQIQSNTQLRDQAVQKVVADFPNIVSMTAPKVIQAKQQAGQDFDAATKGYLDYALRSVAAKGGVNGTVSSGASIQAASDTAAKLGLDKLNYVEGQGNKALDLSNSDWQNQYTEANALRSFQQKMLGQGASQGFSSAQSALQRAQQTNEFNVNNKNSADAQANAQSNELLGSIGKAGTTAALLALTKNPGVAAAAGGSVGSSGAGFSGPATPGYAANTNPTSYGISSGGYR